MKIAEDLSPEDLDTLFSTDLAHPTFVATLSKHFDKQHAKLAGRDKTSATPAQRPISGDGTQRRIPMAGAAHANRFLMLATGLAVGDATMLSKGKVVKKWHRLVCGTTQG